MFSDLIHTYHGRLYGEEARLPSIAGERLLDDFHSEWNRQRHGGDRLSDLAPMICQLFEVNLNKSEPAIVDVVLRELDTEGDRRLGQLFRSKHSLFGTLDYGGGCGKRYVPIEITVIADSIDEKGHVLSVFVLPEYEFCRSIVSLEVMQVETDLFEEWIRKKGFRFDPDEHFCGRIFHNESTRQFRHLHATHAAESTFFHRLQEEKFAVGWHAFDGRFPTHPDPFERCFYRNELFMASGSVFFVMSSILETFYSKSGKFS